MNKTIKVKGFLVKQLTNKPIATASIKFVDLINIVKFTSRESKGYDPFNPEKDVNKVIEEVNKSYFQRLTNEKRVKNIYSFLLKEINNIHNVTKNALGSFPTSIILSLDIDEDFDKPEDYISFIDKLDPKEKVGAFYEINENEIIDLIIPNRKISLIVDGQHRLAAIWKLYNDAKSNQIKIGREYLESKYPRLTNELVLESLNKFDFNCTLLIGFDLWEQGKVFADVNFNQKPVNKSLYYDIFGSYPDQEKNDIFLAHMLAMHLNNNSKSIIKGFIKMLGSGPGYFSQAFFVEAILDHFKPVGVWGHMPVDYLQNGTEYKILPKFFKAYFRTIKNVFSDFWPKPEETTSRKYKNILVKTTGMGALLKLINPIYRDLLRQDFDLNTINEDDLVKKMTKIFEKIKDNGNDYFSSESPYAGAGSLGLQNKLYKALGQEIGYFKK